MSVPSSNGESAALEASFAAFLGDPSVEIPSAVNPVRQRFDEHFGCATDSLPSTTIRYSNYLQVGYRRAVEEFLAEPGTTHSKIGVRCPGISHWDMVGMTVGRLVSEPSLAFAPPVFQPIDIILAESGYGKKEPCIVRGFVVFRNSEGPGVLWFRYSHFTEEMVLEVMTPTLDRSRALSARLRDGAVAHSPFRGQVIEFTRELGVPPVRFLPRPTHTTREEVILPPALLDQIDRHSLGAVAARPALRANGRHLKRGLLLHGRPGTGKTHTIRYLVSQMPEATIVILAARRLWDVSMIEGMIELVEPAVVVLDDVDLIAEERENGLDHPGLFNLLNVLDGLSGDKEVLFLMTTNRPHDLDPAIAARPGRVDQAFEIPLPDSDCRRRLFELYTRKIDVLMEPAQLDEIIARTDGVTSSFIRELVRRATLAALEAGATASPVPVAGEQFLTALDSLLDPTSPLTPLLLGAEPEHVLPTITVDSKGSVTRVDV